MQSSDRPTLESTVSLVVSGVALNFLSDFFFLLFFQLPYRQTTVKCHSTDAKKLGRLPPKLSVCWFSAVANSALNEFPFWPQGCCTGVDFNVLHVR